MLGKSKNASKDVTKYTRMGYFPRSSTTANTTVSDAIAAMERSNTSTKEPNVRKTTPSAAKTAAVVRFLVAFLRRSSISAAGDEIAAHAFAAAIGANESRAPVTATVARSAVATAEIAGALMHSLLKLPILVVGGLHAVRRFKGTLCIDVKAPMKLNTARQKDPFRAAIRIGDLGEQILGKIQITAVDAIADIGKFGLGLGRIILRMIIGPAHIALVRTPGTVGVGTTLRALPFSLAPRVACGL